MAIRPLEDEVRKWYNWYTTLRGKTHRQAISYICRRFWMVREEAIERMVGELGVRNEGLGVRSSLFIIPHS